MMNHKIKVSVIIPVYQVENYLERRWWIPPWLRLWKKKKSFW